MPSKISAPSLLSRKTPLHIDLDPHTSLGVYVHVPFCRRRCPYCDFSIAVRSNIPHQAYRDALLAELSHRADDFSGTLLESVYFGGGTPSLWDPSCLAEVLLAITQRWGSPKEVTIEVNPGGITREHLDALRAAGVNRLSVGGQSLQPWLLSKLGRDHSVEDTLQLLSQAKSAGFDRISLDLIFGVAGQRVEDFKADLYAALELPIEQLSTYSLTIEPMTPFGRQAQRGKMLTASDDESAEMMAAADEVLGAHDFIRYEPSNIARRGRWSRHNLIYWSGAEYLGLGMGAHSMRRCKNGGALRSSNTPDLRRYLSTPTAPPHFLERLTPTTHLAERLFLALRTRFPLDLEALAREPVGASLDRFEATLSKLCERGWAERTPSGIVATAKGLLFHDAVAAAMIEACP